MEKRNLDRWPMQAGGNYRANLIELALNAFGPKGIHSYPSLWRELVKDPRGKELWRELFKDPRVQELISGADQTKLAVGVDTSHWTGTLTPELVKGADVLFPKATDGQQVRAGDFYNKRNYIDSQLYATVQTAYNVGRPVIPFHYFQWNYDQWNLDHIVKFQFDIIKEAFAPLVKGKSYHGIALDLEEPGDTSNNMKTKVEMLYNMLAEDPQFSGLPILFYSSMYFLNMWPGLRDWLSYPNANKLLWLAQWVWTQRWTGNWNQFYEQVLPNVNMTVRTPGYANWTVVQWSAAVTVDGFNLDLNTWNRTPADLYKMLDFTPVSPTPEEPPQDPGDPPVDPDFVKRLETLEGWKLTVDSQLGKLGTHTHQTTGPTYPQ